MAAFVRYFSDGNWLCPAGATPDATSSFCSTCAAGTYKNVEGNSPCTACPSDSICTSTSYPCIAGFEPNGSGGCKPCQSGLVKNSAGNFACHPCPSFATCTSTTITCNALFTLSGTQYVPAPGISWTEHANYFTANPQWFKSNAITRSGVSTSFTSIEAAVGTFSASNPWSYQ